MSKRPEGVEVTVAAITGGEAETVRGLKAAAGQETVPRDSRERYVYRYASTSYAESTFDPGAWVRAVRVEDDIVGLAWLDGETAGGSRMLHRFLIEADHQGRGYGSVAMEMIIEEVRGDPTAGALELQCLPAPGGPEDFFRRLGFFPTGEMRGEEIAMRLDLRNDPGREPTLRPIVPGIAAYLCRLEGSDYVAPNSVSIIQAHHTGDKAWLRAIYVGREPVGLVMLYDDPGEQTYNLWRLMMSPRHRGQGHGRQVIAMVADYVRRVRGGGQLKVSCKPGPEGPEGFYVRLGFTPTGEFWDDEKVFSMDVLA